MVQVFRLSGSWESDTFLPPGLDPVAVAAFASGDILVSSMDPLNKRLVFRTLDATGQVLSTLHLFDDDYLEEKNPGMTLEETDRYRLNTLVGIQFHPRGENLLVVPTGTRMPLLEVSERAVLRSIPLQLPQGAVLDSVQQSEGRTLYVRTAHVKGSATSEMATTADPLLLAYNASNGSLLRRVEVPEQLTPVCHRDDRYIFFEPRKEDAHFQVVYGTETR